MPDKPVQLRVSARDADQRLRAGVVVAGRSGGAGRRARERGRRRRKPIAIRGNGDPAHKVDLLILGDGYAADELGKFEAQTRAGWPTTCSRVSPFKERAGDFNVWALTVPVPESGISRARPPASTAPARSALRYDIFGSERYALTLDNRALRELAQYAPYDFIEILFNSETYGGGGIFGQFSTAAAGNDWADYLFVHEFGHHFAGAGRRVLHLAGGLRRRARRSGSSRGSPMPPRCCSRPAEVEGAARRAGTPLPTPGRRPSSRPTSASTRRGARSCARTTRPESEMSALFARRAARSRTSCSPAIRNATRSAPSRAPTTRPPATTARRCSA